MDICGDSENSENCENNVKKRYISEKTKNIVLDKQYYRCANNPMNPAINLSDYLCLLWKYECGRFDESGYEFDHINEFCKTGNNELENIQALCPMCHSVKTKKFMKNKKFFTSCELNAGAAIMEIVARKR